MSVNPYCTGDIRSARLAGLVTLIGRRLAISGFLVRVSGLDDIKGFFLVSTQGVQLIRKFRSAYCTWTNAGALNALVIQIGQMGFGSLFGFKYAQRNTPAQVRLVLYDKKIAHAQAS